MTLKEEPSENIGGKRKELRLNMFDLIFIDMQIYCERIRSEKDRNENVRLIL